MTCSPQQSRAMGETSIPPNDSNIKWGKIQVLEIPGYNSEEAKEVWYDKDELQYISDAIVETVSLLTKKIDIDENSEEHCMRGLECSTFRGCTASMVSRKRTKIAVLEEQKSQKKQGCVDQEAIALKARSVSERYMEEAMKIGLQDQNAADRYLNRRRQTKAEQPQKNSSLLRRLLTRRSRRKNSTTPFA